MPTCGRVWCVIRGDDPNEGDRNERDLDEQSLIEFLRNDYRRVVAGVALLSGDLQGAEDAVGEAVTLAWERVRNGDRIDSMPAWITVVASNHARSRLRRAGAERRATRRLDARPGGSDGDATTLSDATLDTVRLLRGLPLRQRQACVLHHWLDMPVVDVAAALGVSEGTVKTALSRGREQLRRMLDEPGGEPTHADV